MAYTTIDDPTAYFQTVLYSGTGSSQSITYDGNSDMQPDFLWFKRRDAAANHRAVDSVRGNTKGLNPNQTNAEDTLTDQVTAFNSDGFSLGAGSQGYTNTSGGTFVSWGWKAGTSFTNDASGTGIGSIDSAGSVNTDAGFSIISYTGNATDGATIAHGLGVTPDVIIAKSRASVEGWGFFHSSFSSQEYMFLNTTSPKGSASTVWNALPGSAVFTVGSNGSVNASGTMIAYCFAEKQGYSKFGSYVGNGNADGTFVYTGFKPAMVIFKDIDGTNDWRIGDTARIDAQGGNGQGIYSFPNTNAAEQDATTRACDYLSNGFKIRHSDGSMNGSGTEYIYMAFASNPFVSSSGVPACAR